ncbi:MAG: class D beta-lactamase [Bacteroidota bacterium]
MRCFISRFFFLLGILLCFSACKKKQSVEIRGDFKKYYDQYNVEGSFALYDTKNDQFILYNPAQFKEPFIPASTFKICNSLIGLETGVITDENFIIQWDGTHHPNENWNYDQDLKTSFKNSTVWYYQELARRVDGTLMKYWLDQADYGNADTSGGIDRFWLSGGLRISPKQQIDFLRRLHDDSLPFSKRSMAIVRKIMIASDTLGVVLRAKTGWGSQNKLEIGWYVGYFETKDNVYYFANCIQTPDPNNLKFGQARIEIPYQIMNELKLLKN